MKRVVVEQFGGVETLRVIEEPTPEPGAGEVRVRLTSVGMNHADLMARRGEYKLSSGEPPFTPGLEGGGVIEAIGGGVTWLRIGDRVILGNDLRTPGQGAYRTHVVCRASGVVPAPPAHVIPDEQLGAIWLTYLTAWGCLVWKQQLKPGQFVGIPAASSGVGLAAAQVVKRAGGVAIGLTSSPAKVDRIRATPRCSFDHLVVTANEQGPLPWYKDIRRVTNDHGIDVYFDPVAAGNFLGSEIRTLAQHGTIWVYGLLGAPGLVDVSPLIRKHAAIRGWLVSELTDAGEDTLQAAYRAVLDGFADGSYRQHVDRLFALDDVRAAHEYMERGGHVGKLVLVP